VKVDPRAERAVVWVAAAAVSLPILSFRYPPMLDLPQHEAIVGLLRHFGDPSFAPPGLYVLNLGHGNQLFHFLALALSYVVPLDWACKIVVAATIVANVVLAGRLAAYRGASRWSALLVVPAILGWLFLMGFAHDLLGMALLVGALPALDRHCERPTVRGALAVGALTLLLHFAHDSAMVVFAGAALLFAAVQPLDARGTPLRVAPFSFALAIELADLRWMAPMNDPAIDAVPTVFIPVAHKLSTIPIILLGRYAPWLVYPMFALCVVAVVWMIVERTRAEGEPVPRFGRAFLRRYRFELFAAGAFAGYLVFPSTLHGASLLYQRFLAPAYVLVVVLAPPRDGSMGATPRVLAALAPVLTLAALWPVFQDSSATARALDRIFSHVREGSAVALVELDPVDPARVYLPSGASSRVLAVRGGRALPSFTESPNAAVMTNRAVRWDETMLRLSKHRFIPSHDLKEFRYVIVHTAFDGTAVLAKLALAHRAKLRAVSGEWLLFESTAEVAPVVSPEAPLENPQAPTLLERIAEVYAAWKAAHAAR